LTLFRETARTSIKEFASSGFVLPLAFAAACLAATAHAEPPPNADGSKAEFYQSLMVPGTNLHCCNQSDCRPTDFRPTVGNHWQFFISGRNFGNRSGPDTWITANDKAEIKKLDHPIPYDDAAVACYVEGKILCYVLPNRPSAYRQILQRFAKSTLAGPLCLRTN
jgi:hypothetical protein